MGVLAIRGLFEIYIWARDFLETPKKEFPKNSGP